MNIKEQDYKKLIKVHILVKKMSKMSEENIKLKLTEKEILQLKNLLVDWEDDNISDYEYANKVGEILKLGGWSGKGKN